MNVHTQYLTGKLRRSGGFTLIEMGIVLAILGVLVLVGMMAIDWEAGAAGLVDATQGSVEAVVRQGMAHTDGAAQSSAVVTGTQTYIRNYVLNGNPQVSSFNCDTGAATCTITLADGKTAVYAIATDATVGLSSISGFGNYGVTDGRIAAS
jgi:prepilin-type N-terminal cleavage/methylation domain-containing protein